MSKCDMDFGGNGLLTDSDGTIPCGNVLSRIQNLCGFKRIASTSNSGMEFIKFTPEMLEGKTCRGVLEIISATMCGVWLADSDDGAILRCLGEPFPGYVSTAKEYAEIDYQGSQKITKLIVTDSESGDVHEYSTGEYGTVITIETPFPQVGSIVWGRIQNFIYTAWNCEKALIDDAFPDIPVFTQINFGDAALSANNFTIDVDSTGVYFSGGNEPQDEEQWRYEEYLQREVNERVKIGKTVGNTQVAQTGIQYVYKNENSPASRSAENTSVEKYGFTVNKGGVTEYDGALIDKTDFEYVEKVDDNTAIVAYPNAKYKCTRTVDGNKHYYKTERVE